jgi:uncharacterized protein YegJ (DUF2314 family)
MLRRVTGRLFHLLSRLLTLSLRKILFRTLTSSLVVVGVCSCSKKKSSASANVFPSGSPTADSMRFEYAVYMLPLPARAPSVVLRQALSRQFRELKLVDKLPKQPRETVVHYRIEKDVQHKYAPPGPKSMKYFGRGISPDQAEAVQKSHEAFILEFAHPKEKLWAGLRGADTLVELIARATKGLIWDNETRELFSADEWHTRRLAKWTSDPPEIANETTVHVYQDGEFVRAITLGMAKVGLPDVVVEDSPHSTENQVVNLINAFCQSMVEGATFKDPGKYNLDLHAIQNYKITDLGPNAMGSACLSLKNGKWEEGDPENRLIQLTFDKYAGSDVQAKEKAMITSFLGASDAHKDIEHTEQLLEASRKARTKLPELRRAFNAGLEPGGFIELKAPFKIPDGRNEWMWVEVTAWNGNVIRGILDNTPEEVPNLHAGQVVEVNEADVFDYIRHYADKHSEGNTTDEIIAQMGNGASPQQHPVTQVPNPCSAD